MEARRVVEEVDIGVGEDEGEVIAMEALVMDAVEEVMAAMADAAVEANLDRVDIADIVTTIQQHTA